MIFYWQIFRKIKNSPKFRESFLFYKFLFNFDLHFFRFCGWCKASDYLSIFANKKFCKIPFDIIPMNLLPHAHQFKKEVLKGMRARIFWFFIFEKSIKRTFIFTVDINSRKKRECDTMIEATYLLHCFVRFRRLMCELIAWETKNYKIIWTILLPELFESIKLRSKSTFSCSIDDEKNFSFIIFKRNILAFSVFDRKIVNCFHKNF